MEPQSKQYTCKNPGECEKSDKGEIIEIAPGDDLICPGCKRNTLEPYEAKKKFPFWVYPVVIALALALCGGIYFGYLKYIAPSEVSKKPVTQRHRVKTLNHQNHLSLKNLPKSSLRKVSLS
jgi:hypothetical protein